jgi:oxalate decarboxylase/phosphoglucose isomerase-like protein (cupin superfamily)
VPSKLVDPASLPTMSFDWGLIKPLVAADNTEGTAVSLVHVVLLPGQGHERHNHPDADEVLYVLAGEGEQAIYAPAGAEAALTGLPDYREIPAGEAPSLRRGTSA